MRRRAAGYAHAKQFKRLKRVPRCQRAILGSLLREVRRKMTNLGREAQDALNVWLQRAGRIHVQRPKDKNTLYALHAPEVACIGKGKARQPCEFGVKGSMAIMHKNGLVVGARSFPSSTYDGHTLAQQCHLSFPGDTPRLSHHHSFTHFEHYSTVTDFARFRGLSTSVPRAQAV